MLDPLLLEVLVCPEDRGPLWYFDDDQVLYNPRLRRKYLIRDGIPVLLIEEGVAVDLDDHRRYSERADAGDVPETGQGRAAGTARQPVQPGQTAARASDGSAEGSDGEAAAARGGDEPEGADDAAGEAAKLAEAGSPATISGPDDPPAGIGGLDEARTPGDHRED